MNQAWYHTRNGQQVGPVTLEELRQRAAVGELQADDLVWREGMADWIAAGQAPEMAAAFGATADQGSYDLQPGQAASPAAPYAVPYAAAPYPAAGYPGGVLSYSTPPIQLHYAGFWIRFVATLVDGIILSVPNFIFTAMARSTPTATGQPSPQDIGIAAMMNVVLIVIGWLYEALFTSSAYQATPGKLLVGIRIADLHGNRISFGRATGRHFAKILSAIICGIGYIMAAFDAQKRALHDQICGTLVTYKTA
jgi:uncharacterized RDD family membrane protein YckC